MALKVNIHDVKTHLSRLLTRVGEGEEIIISKAGRPVAILTPIEKRPKKRLPGSAKGKIIITKDFDEPLPNFILEAFKQ